MIKPFADQVVLEQQAAETKTASGLYIPSGAAEKPKIGKVVAVGKDVKEVKKGMEIIYKPYAVTSVKSKNTEYLIIKEEDCIGEA